MTWLAKYTRASEPSRLVGPRSSRIDRMTRFNWPVPTRVEACSLRSNATSIVSRMLMPSLALMIAMGAKLRPLSSLRM